MMIILRIFSRVGFSPILCGHFLSYTRITSCAFLSPLCCILQLFFLSSSQTHSSSDSFPQARPLHKILSILSPFESPLLSNLLLRIQQLYISLIGSQVEFLTLLFDDSAHVFYH